MYKKGQSGNPSGRPPGIPDRRNALHNLLDSNAPQLLARLVEIALTGDVQALKICTDRLIPIPKAKPEPTGIELPSTINGKNMDKLKHDILLAVVNGSLSPDDGDKILKMMESSYGKTAPTATINFLALSPNEAAKVYQQVMIRG